MDIGMDETKCWVEALEPSTKDPVYVNLGSGELSWNPPKRDKIKHVGRDQWWQLFDSSTKCYYYHNAVLEKTVWESPQNADIIPLSKLQTLHRIPWNAQKTVATQTFVKLDTYHPNHSVNDSDYSSMNRSLTDEHKSLPGIQNGQPRDIEGAEVQTEKEQPIYDVPAGDLAYSTVPINVHCNKSPTSKHLQGSMASVDSGLPTEDHELSFDSGESSPPLPPPPQLYHPSQHPPYLSTFVSPSHNQPQRTTGGLKVTPVGSPALQQRRRNFPRTNPTCSRNSGKRDSLVASVVEDNDEPHMSTELNLSHKQPVNTPSTVALYQSKSKLTPIGPPSVDQSLAPHPQLVPIPPPHGIPATAVLVTTTAQPPSPLTFADAPSNHKNSLDSNGSANSPSPKRRTGGVITRMKELFNSEYSRSSGGSRPQSMVLIDNDVNERMTEPPPRGPLTPPPMSISNRTSSLPAVSPEKKQLLVGSGVRVGRLQSLDTAWCTLDIVGQGLVARNVSVLKLLAWSKDPISKPLLLTTDKQFKKQALDIFKNPECSVIRMYMGDYKAKLSQSELAVSLVQKCWSTPGIRDELYMQLLRQITQNPDLSSLTAGWQLICICLSFFPPSVQFTPFLEVFLERHLVSLPEEDSSSEDVEEDLSLEGGYKNSKVSGSGPTPLWIPHGGSCGRSKGTKLEATSSEERDLMLERVYEFVRVSNRRLRKAVTCGARTGSVVSDIDVQNVTVSILSPGMFYSTLEEVMRRQRDRFPELKLPWIQKVLVDEVLSLGGLRTLGIFRVSGDYDLVQQLKHHCELWKAPKSLNYAGSKDPHIPASLLKLWLRELSEPIIPEDLYSKCLLACDNAQMAQQIVRDELEPLNRHCLMHIVRFLQLFIKEGVTFVTKMDENNLSMVMAPNILRTMVPTTPESILTDTRPQMCFIRNLILNLDTSEVSYLF